MEQASCSVGSSELELDAATLATLPLVHLVFCKEDFAWDLDAVGTEEAGVAVEGHGIQLHSAFLGVCEGPLDVVQVVAITWSGDAKSV